MTIPAPDFSRSGRVLAWPCWPSFSCS
jgi:hypothetical protein